MGVSGTTDKRKKGLMMPAMFLSIFLTLTNGTPVNIPTPCPITNAAVSSTTVKVDAAAKYVKTVMLRTTKRS
jgi:hypothetical protein